MFFSKVGKILYYGGLVRVPTEGAIGELTPEGAFDSFTNELTPIQELNLTPIRLGYLGKHCEQVTYVWRTQGRVWRQGLTPDALGSFPHLPDGYKSGLRDLVLGNYTSLSEALSCYEPVALSRNFAKIGKRIVYRMDYVASIATGSVVFYPNLKRLEDIFSSEVREK